MNGLDDIMALLHREHAAANALHEGYLMDALPDSAETWEVVRDILESIIGNARDIIEIHHAG